MSDFTVLRSLDGYCLVLDKKRIAGGKPDYRGENVLVDWTTEVVYGPVDDLAAENAKLVMKLNAEHLVRQNVERENAKLRELVRYAYECAVHSDHATCDECRRMNGYCILENRMRELGVDA